MNLIQLFEILLSDRIATIRVACKPESLRVSLTRKFSDYKEQMGKLGFLAEDLAEASLSLEWDKEKQIATFHIRKKVKKMIEYTIVEPLESQDGNRSALTITVLR